MSELSILDLDAEHAELLPERETLSVFGLFNGGGNHVTVVQIDSAAAGHALIARATAVSTAIINVG
jgi:hypothetical protein